MNRLMSKAGLHGALLVGFAATALNSSASVNIQCGDPDDTDDKISCVSLTGGDGWLTMGDGDEIYIFGFSDVADIPEEEILEKGVFRANFPAPTIHTREGDELYISLTNVGTLQRPDLFDPHTVHYHGFPNASAIFDGLPESAVSINQQSTITYYYNNVEPGTYMYHCHVEATEHMQMGMLGNLYVDPIQNQVGYTPSGATAPDPATLASKEGHDTAQLGYVYNDGDGSTAFDVEVALQLQALDKVFHDASRDTQPLPFADMVDSYPTINGRGYPHTTIPGNLHNCDTSNDADPGGVGGPIDCPSNHPDGSIVEQDSPQPVDALVEAVVGDRVLIRLSNLGVVNHYTVTVMGIPMKVVGRGARLLRGEGQQPGENVFYDTNVVNIGGGESTDIILDTSGVSAGTYYLYSTNLNYLSNHDEDFGGYMTEIILSEAGQ